MSLTARTGKEHETISDDPKPQGYNEAIDYCTELAVSLLKLAMGLSSAKDEKADGARA